MLTLPDDTQHYYRASPSSGAYPDPPDTAFADWEVGVEALLTDLETAQRKRGLAMLLACGVPLVLLLCASLAHAASVTLTWDAGPGPMPTGYRVERKVGTGIYAVIAEPTAPPYTDATVPTQTPVCWQVRAWNVLGQSPPSNAVCLDLPGVPMNLTVQTSGPSPNIVRTKTTTRIRKSR